jgi:hypothetical protein
MSRAAFVVMIGTGVLFSSACADVAGPNETGEPPPAPAADSALPAVGALLATPCDVGTWGPGLDALRRRGETALVDIVFGRPWSEEPHAGPSADEVGLVEAHGGKVLHRFHVPAVRARIALARVPALVSGEAWVFVRQVPDAASQGVVVVVDHGVAAGEAEVAAFEALGGRVLERHAGHPLLVGILPDEAIPALRASLGAGRVSAERVYCRAG